VFRIHRAIACTYLHEGIIVHSVRDLKLPLLLLGLPPPADLPALQTLLDLAELADPRSTQIRLLSLGSPGLFQETSVDIIVGSRLKPPTAIALWYARHRTRSLGYRVRR
jgi:hypothetical protein